MEWHLRQAWEPLLFEDEELTVDRRRRDPVAPAQASESARLKKKTHMTPGGLPVQSFRTLLAHLGTRCRNTCVVTADPNQTTFRQVTEADALQAEALRLIKMQDSQPVVLQPVKVINIAAELIGGRVANRRLQDSAGFRGAGHQSKLDLAGQIELEGQLLVGGFEQAVALGEFVRRSAIRRCTRILAYISCTSSGLFGFWM